ncbi:hypothetical protein OK074_5103 [Actinobacteria bacterium OK074]|nr:hypothetical protein OK074_5103 [Actinobacteria bacterium OK074]
MISNKWIVVEKLTVSKQAGGDGEDRLALAYDGEALTLVAVVDGATDKSGRDYGGKTGGARAAECVAGTLQTLPAGSAPAAALDAVTDQLAALRRNWSISTDDLLAPSAVAAVLLPERGQIWRVGDVHVAIRRDGHWETHPAEKEIDRAVAGARAALLHCRLAQGDSMEALAATDPGREMVMPILKAQNVLANTDGDNPLGFGVLDGRRVPPRYLEVFDLDESVTEVVLASDGYVWAAPTLREAEANLAASLASDPLRIGEHASTKAVSPGASSYDDRTYIRVRVG